MSHAPAYLEILAWLVAYLLLVCGFARAVRRASRRVELGEQGERLGRLKRGRGSAA